MLPGDLSRAQRSGLVALVVVLHALIAWFALTRVVPPSPVEPQPTIEVRLISAEPVEAVTQPAPAKAAAAPPTGPAVHKPQPVAPPILAAAKPAQPGDRQAAPPTPVTEAKPAAAPPTPVTPTTASPAQPAAQTAEPVHSPAPALVLPSSALRYLIKPETHYPRVSQELGESGQVLLQVLIDEQGRPVSVTIAKSSGFPRLDQEAIREMKAARFQPRIVDGVARSVSTVAPFDFNLEEP